MASQEAALARRQGAGAAEGHFRGALAWCDAMADLVASLSGVRLLELGPNVLRLRLTTAAGKRPPPRPAASWSSLLMARIQLAPNQDMLRRSQTRRV